MKNNYHSILEKECTLSGPLAGVLVDTNRRLCNCCRVFLAVPHVFTLLGNSIKTSLKGLETGVKLAAHHSFSSFIPLICSHKTQKTPSSKCWMLVFHINTDTPAMLPYEHWITLTNHDAPPLTLPAQRSLGIKCSDILREICSQRHLRCCKIGIIFIYKLKECFERSR